MSLWELTSGSSYHLLQVNHHTLSHRSYIHVAMVKVQPFKVLCLFTLPKLPSINRIKALGDSTCGNLR